MVALFYSPRAVYEDPDSPLPRQAVLILEAFFILAHQLGLNHTSVATALETKTKNSHTQIYFVMFVYILKATPRYCFLFFFSFGTAV
jgi:ABC-type arginine/histidine transport system permease subunit